MDTVDHYDARAALWQAKMCECSGDWSGAENFATIALEADPTLVGAYCQRALARRILGNLGGAIADYDQVLVHDPQYAPGLHFRGACRSTLAARLPREEARTLQAEAERDFRRAVRLEPSNEQAALSMVEAAICAERYREAFGYAGECWRNLRQGSNRVICAWLGCIAAILARRPRKTWQCYIELLQRREVMLPRMAWCITEINGVIACLYEIRTCDASTLAEIEVVHNIFVGHFGEMGPLLQ